MTEVPADAECGTGGTVEAKADVQPDESRAALIAGVFCYVLWGLVTYLFKALSLTGVGAWETTSARCLWAVLLAGLLVAFTRKTAELRVVLSSPRTLMWLAFTAVAIGINWTIFVWASENGHNVDASMGYYLNPLINMAAGAVLFREKVSRGGWIAMALAAVGVALPAIALGHPPLISLGLAASFGIYGIVRKHVSADAVTGLFVECFILAWPALGFLIWLESSGRGHASHPLAMGLLFLAGVLTVAPLAAFSWAARRMPLSTMGFIQFLGPTLQFLAGVSLGEQLTPLRILSFVFIWAGVSVFAFDSLRRSRVRKAAAAA